VSIEKKKKRKLTLELVLMTVISLIAGVFVAQLVEDISLQLIMQKIGSDDYYERQTQDCLDRLSNFITSNQVTEQNIELLASWAQKESNVYVVFYRDVEALFSSNTIFFTEDEEVAIPLNGTGLPYYDVSLFDGTIIKAELDCYMDPHLFYLVDIAGYMMGGTIFVMLLFLLIHQKIRYINRLHQELKILGSGNLEYTVTIRGNDEITGLAEGIENLKNGILDQQLMKDEAEKANMELVTAMSHDLRTPLTSLIGYLELLTMQRYEDEAQMQKYLEHCREKAFQLKKMSDRLFEYFLVYGKRDYQYQFHTITCENLLEDLCNSQFFDWQEQGGTLICQIDALSGIIQVDSEYLQRVIDNLISNLKKYGDLNQPLEIMAYEKDQTLSIRICNHIKPMHSLKESTQIGLRTCQRIMGEHKGSFSWSQEGEYFMVELTFPLLCFTKR
jgi:signal transduction histidine kinase